MGCLPGLLGGSAQSQSSEARRAASSAPPVFLHIWSRGRCWRSVSTPTPHTGSGTHIPLGPQGFFPAPRCPR